MVAASSKELVVRHGEVYIGFKIHFQPLSSYLHRLLFAAAAETL